jgi:peptide/nickel transport system substrate-binding protein
MTATGNTAAPPEGGQMRILFSPQAGLDYIDPALSFTAPGWAVIDTFCARLLTYPDKPPPAGFRIVPEVAAAMPTHSPDYRAWTFRLRKRFRFSDGKPVHASAFARAILRTLAPNVDSPGAIHTQYVVGAADVLAGRARTARGVVAKGDTLTVRLTRSDPSFPARMTLPFFCAVPPNLPSGPEGIGPFPAAGAYYVDSYTPGKTILLRRNRFYGGARPHHVDSFRVDLDAPTVQDMVARVDRGEYDWAAAISGLFFTPAVGIAQKYGVNVSPRFSIRPGLGISMLVFNSSRPIFRSNPDLRKAVNFALDRKAIEQFRGGSAPGPSTDQLLPYAMPGFKDADVYPLGGPDLVRARAFADGNLRGGKVVFYAPDSPLPLATAQLVKTQLRQIGLDVTIVPISLHIASAEYLETLVQTDAPWDLALVLWTPNLPDPAAFVDLLLSGRLPGRATLPRFESSDLYRAMQQAGSISDAKARLRAYGEVDVRVMREDAPVAPLGVINEATLVSDRVGCIVLRPALDLTAVCLRR